ncbi:MAG: hypothetical protein OEY19_09245 [Gammaproteobacteria bacterium]|nr:hypothetical protein [Gammaproteobacteria bacterium]MDH5629595.1 hypothetical protein [Gammaproteobacteria bacterium]
MKIINFVLICLLSFSVHAEYSEEEMKEIYCSQISTDLSIKLQAIGDLKREAPIKAKKVIEYLEEMAKLDVMMLNSFEDVDVCTTDDIKVILDTAEELLTIEE